MTHTLFAAGKVPPRTLGGGRQHVYVTRRATLEFQQIDPRPFEEARRELTKLALHARPSGNNPRIFCFPYAGRDLFVYVVDRDPDLLVVAGLAEDAPEGYPSGPTDGEAQ